MKVAILGMGAMGIALTKIIKNDIEISMWTNFEYELKSVELKRENTQVLPGIKIDENVCLTTSLKEAVDNSEIIFLAVPAVAVRSVSEILKEYIADEQIICILTKGIEKDSNMFMVDIVKEVINTNNICVFSGPSFAIDVANNSNIGMVIAGEYDVVRRRVSNVFEEKYVNIAYTSDVIGVEISSAIKNVFAIVCGMFEGKNESDSTKSAAFSVIFNDYRLALTLLGGKEATIFSYAGIGDLMLTCMSEKSRNYTFGKMLGLGKNKEEALESMKVKTIEGLYTLDAIYDILNKKLVNINSINLLYDVVYNNKKVDNLLKEIIN